ncbi:MAG: YbjN domain-containing protein [Sphingomonadales bacterium]
METALPQEHPDGPNPLDVIEQIVGSHEWVYDRSSDSELTVTTSSTWCQLHLHFSWTGTPSALQTICAFDAPISDGRRSAVLELVALINSQLWIGHFDVLSDENFIMFRYVMLLPDDTEVTEDQCEEVLKVALSESERFYPAFQFVLWSGQTPKEALAAALIETVGEA